MSNPVGQVLNVVVWLSFAGFALLAGSGIAAILCIIAMLVGMIYYNTLPRS